MERFASGVQFPATSGAEDKPASNGRPHQLTRLHSTPSLPNLRLPHPSRANGVSYDASAGSLLPRPHLKPLDLAAADSTTSTPTPTTSHAKTRAHYKCKPLNLLTPPLTPSSSFESQANQSERVKRMSVANLGSPNTERSRSFDLDESFEEAPGDVDTKVETNNEDLELAERFEKSVALVSRDGVESATRFLLVSNVPRAMSTLTLKTLFAPFSADVKGIYIKLQESRGIVILAFWDDREAAKVKYGVGTLGFHGAAMPNGVGEHDNHFERRDGPPNGHDIVKESEAVAVRFVGADDLVKLIGRSPFLSEVQTQGEFYVALDSAVSDADRAGQKGRDVASSLKDFLGGFGTLKVFEKLAEIEGEVFRVEYHDTREATAAFDALDNKVVFGVRLRLFRTDVEQDNDSVIDLSHFSPSTVSFPRTPINLSPVAAPRALPATEPRPRRTSVGEEPAERSLRAAQEKDLFGRRVSNVHLFERVRDSTPVNGNGVEIEHVPISPNQRGSDASPDDTAATHGAHAYYATGAHLRPSPASQFQHYSSSMPMVPATPSEASYGHVPTEAWMYAPSQTHVDAYYVPGDRGVVYYHHRPPPASYNPETTRHQAMVQPEYPAAPAYGYPLNGTQPHIPAYPPSEYRITPIDPRPSHDYGAYTQHTHVPVAANQPGTYAYTDPSATAYAYSPTDAFNGTNGINSHVSPVFNGSLSSRTRTPPPSLRRSAPLHSNGAGSGLSPGGERNQLDLQRIEDGLDTRTTVMIKNIPNKMSDKDLIAYIGKVCPKRIDFLYLRMDFKNGCNVGYAFVNFITVQDMVQFAKARLGVKWNMYSSEKTLYLCYANYQGKEALVEKFRNSCIMDEREEWRPKIFYSDGPNQGLSEPFPRPTHLRRKERSSHNRGALFVPGIHHGHQNGHAGDGGMNGVQPSFYQPPFKRSRRPPPHLPSQ